MGQNSGIVKDLLRNFIFSGRASLSEFWSFAGLVFLAVSVALIAIVRGEADFGIFTASAFILYFSPPLTALITIPLAVRRLRDAGTSAWAFAIPAVLSGFTAIAILTRYITFNFAETTGLSQTVWSWSGIQSTSVLVFSAIAVPIQCLWMIGFCLLPSSKSSASSGPIL